MKTYYADIHCHPHARAFHWLRHGDEDPERGYHAWNIVLSNFKKQKQGARAFSYSQCDPVKLWNGEVKLVYASLYPFEKGFYEGTDDVKKAEVVKLFEKASQLLVTVLVPWKGILALVKGAIKKYAGDEVTAREYFQSFLMRMPIRRIQYFTGDKYDYYKELIRERDFLLNKSGHTGRNRIFIPSPKNIFKSAAQLRKAYPDSLDARGQFRVCKNYQEVSQTLEQDNIAMVLTIEGMHALGTDTHPDKVLTRIREIKRWEYPVFFVTFAHHFDNGLCGHAHSLIDSTKWFMSQKKGMDAGFKSIGLEAVRLLLSLDNSLEVDTSLGRRILIDLKHTSAKSRKEYYKKIVEPCYDKDIEIPVILSHVGYSGWKTLDESIQYAEEGKEKDDRLRNGFYPWNINACNEDIEWAVKTNGLIGLCLDQRILGGGSKHGTGKKELVFKNLHAMLDVVAAMPAPFNSQLWYVFCLGSDFEGYIDPVNRYADALDYATLRNDLIDYVAEKLLPQGNKYFLGSMDDVVEAVDNICFYNAKEFLKRNFR
jgi:hypothetical protein